MDITYTPTPTSEVSATSSFSAGDRGGSPYLKRRQAKLQVRSAEIVDRAAARLKSDKQKLSDFDLWRKESLTSQSMAERMGDAKAAVALRMKEPTRSGREFYGAGGCYRRVQR